MEHISSSAVVKRDLQITDSRKSERWVAVHVDEAYIHCSKHIPLLKKLDKTIHWEQTTRPIKAVIILRPRAHSAIEVNSPLLYISSREDFASGCPVAT